MNDDQLRRLLLANPARIRLKSSFKRAVWARIEAADSGVCAVCVQRLSQTLFTWLGRPVHAAMAIAASLALGAWLGSAVVPDGHRDRGEISYVKSINPLVYKQTGYLP